MKIPFLSGNKNHLPDFLSRFDSATDMVSALSAYLHGGEYSRMGTVPMGKIIAPLINGIPDKWKQNLYFYGGVYDSTSQDQIDKIRAEDMDRWIYHLYPHRKYQAIAIGSANGALNHLYAALGIPWLPNTFLIPFYKGRKYSVDKPEIAIDWSAPRARHFLENNPDWALYQMMDPVHDRLRAGSIAYFRVKKLVLGRWYEKFIRDFLMPGGTIYMIDCRLTWPVIRLGDRYTFQFGGLGDVDPDEYYFGSDRIRRFLAGEKTDVEKWDISEPDAVYPEAEWGMNRELLKDIGRFCESKDYRLSKITFNHPQDPSPNVADLIREWNRSKNQTHHRLIIESFNIHSPWIVMNTRSVPFWLFFNTNPAAESIEEYIKLAKPYDEILMMILSHGKRTVGGVGIERWRTILAKAGKRGRFVGMDTKNYPLDLGIYTHYKNDMKRIISERYPPDQLGLKDFEDNYSIFFNDQSISLKHKVL